MRTGRIVDWVVAVLALAASVAHGQAAGASGSRVPVSPRGPAFASRVAATEIVREIYDPYNGDRWLLMHDPSHPGGPGLLMLVSAVRTYPKNPSGLRPAGPEAETPAPVIRSGDRVIVEENTPVVEARLEAVAMAPAALGSSFSVRLKIGGKVVRAVALAPGRAVFQEETEGQR